jgi:methyl-accepting chemotaxis protein
MRLNSSGYFEHHGPWALGVKLFRVLRFTPKALIISAVLLIPLAVLFCVYLQKQLDDENFAKTELQGVAVIKVYAPVIRGAIDLRNATRALAGNPAVDASVDQARLAFEESLRACDKFLTDSGDPLKFQPSLTKVKDLYAAARAKNTLMDASSGGTVWDPVAEAAKTVEQDLADKSNLSLDPDAGSYYLQAVVTGEVSTIAGNLGQLRSWSVWFAAKGGADSKDERKFVIWDSRVTEHIDTLRDDLSRALAAEPSLSINLEPLDIVAAYQKAASGSVLDWNSTDTKVLWKNGAGAQDSLFSVDAQVLPLLEGLLNRRIDGYIKERSILLAVLGVCLVAAAYLFYSFYLVMQGGLNEVRRHLDAMTKGDLTTEARAWGRDEVASLISSLAQMQDSLRVIVGQVRDSSDSIVQASSEIASASMDLSGRTEKTAADLAADAASMQQVSSAVNDSASHAHEAAALAEGNSAVAAKGGEVIAEVVSTMQRIHKSSSKIGEIIATIDGIAFQTNILALNAAVEAARAGDQGRGFAVVASEVRNLAQRSALAAKEIKTLITGSVDEVATGTRVVEGAGVTMEQLVTNAGRMNDLLAQIAAKAREQSTGVGQVGASIMELDNMTQQNAALVEQTAAAAESLREQATSLSHHVSHFTVPEPV